MLKNNLPVFFIYLILIFVGFGPLFKTFFQQDEWAIFGIIISRLEFNFLERILFSFGTHLIPLSNAVSLILFDLFKINFTLYALFGLGLHALMVFLVFYLGVLISGKRLLSFAAGLLFAFNSFSHQAVTWTGTVTGTLGSNVFTLLSLILFVSYLKKGEKDFSYYFLSILALVISLFFKETSIFIFVFLPVLWWIFSEERNAERFKRMAVPLLGIGFLYFLLRVFLLMNIPLGPSSAGEVFYAPAPLVYFFRLITLPLKMMAQSFIPAGLILAISTWVVRFSYPHYVNADDSVNGQIAETAAADIVIYGFAALMVFLLITLFKQAKFKPLFLFSVLLIIFSSFSFILIPSRAGYFSIFEPRHLYFPNIGSSFIILIGLAALAERLKGCFKRPRTIVAIFLVLLLAFHFSKIQLDLNRQARLGNLRKAILVKIQKEYPVLPSRVVFYTESDKAYYGLPPEEKILPFQSGFGQTLLVWYWAETKDHLPNCLFEDKFLYELLSEGYRECEGRGFGYYRDWDKLSRAILENHLSSESVIAFSYNSADQSLVDITSKIRSRL